MAYIFQEQEGLTKDESEALGELNSFHLVSESFAWRKIKEKLEALADESKEEMIGCAPETTLEQRGVLQIRWQQREAVKRELLNFVDAHIEQRSRMLEELKEYGNPDADAGNNS